METITRMNMGDQYIFTKKLKILLIRLNKDNPFLYQRVLSWWIWT